MASFTSPEAIPMLRDADEVLGRICRVFRRRIKDAGKKVFLILDKLQVHHSKLVKAWVAERQDH